MRYALPMLVLACAACDPDLPPEIENPWRYEAGCVHEIRSEVPLRQDRVDAEFARAQTALTSNGVLTDAEFCELFGAFPFNLYYGDTIGSGDWGGLTDPYHGSYLAMPGGQAPSLAHEMLHEVDFSRAAFDTQHHAGWDRGRDRIRAYFSIAQEYEAQRRCVQVACNDG